MALIRADRLERGVLLRMLEPAAEYTRLRDERLARLIATELVEAWNRGQKRGR